MNSTNNNLTNYSSNQQNQNYQNNYNLQHSNMFDYTNNILINPVLIFILVFVVIIYLVLFFSLGDNGYNSNYNSNSNGDSSSEDNIAFKIITIIIFLLFLLLVGLNIAQYYFGVNIVASVKNIFTNQPAIDIAVTTPSYTHSLSSHNPVPEIKLNKQVFNIPGNDYNFSDAKSLCKAYGAELANYKQIEDAYDNGAEWCNYGWSDGQMALFPTQTSSFDKLQKIQGHENDCGRPGINGGIMANPDLKFGVNCFGYKPVMRNNEKELMQQVYNYPRTMKDIAMEQRVNYWREHIPGILVSPFNHKNWSKI